MNDATRSGEQRFQELMLQEVRATVGKLEDKLDAYHDEATVTNSTLSLHIATCDMRYAAAQKKIVDQTPIGTPHIPTKEHESALFSKNRLVKRVVDGVVEHFGLIVVLTVVNGLFFAYTHGFHQAISP